MHRFRQRPQSTRNMTSLRMNASKAEARKLAGRESSQYDEEWNNFEVD